MEQPCYKCGQAVEQGMPFCPHCSAPQIRVVLAEPEEAATTFAAHATASQATADLPASQAVPVLALSMAWSQVVRPCALAALVACVLKSLGLNPFVAMFSVGFLAVVFYRQHMPVRGVKALAGARLGALSGLFWFGMSSILEAVLVLVLHKGPEIRAQLMDKIGQAASQTSDPQVLAVFDRLKTPSGFEFLMVCGLIFAFLASVVPAGLGGALGGAVLGRRDRA